MATEWKKSVKGQPSCTWRMITNTYGVGLMLNKEVAKAVIGWKPVNDRIITVRFQSRHIRATVIQVYALTEESNDADKDAFYGQLQDGMNDIPSQDVKLLITEMYVKIDKKKHGLVHVIGPHGSADESNDSGE